MKLLRQLAGYGVFRLRHLGALLGLGAAAATVQMAGQAAVPVVVGSIVDEALLARSSRALLVRVVVMIGAALLGTMARGVHQVVFAALGERSRAALQTHLLARLQQLPLSFFDRESSGRLQSLLSEDAASAARLTYQMLSEATLGILQLAILLGVLASRYGRVVFAALLLVPLYVLFPLSFSRRTRGAARAALAATAEVSANLQETIQAVREVKLFGREEWALARLARRLADDVSRQVRLALVRSVYGLDYVVYMLAGSAVYWWGGQAVLAGRLTVGALVALVALLTFLEAPVGRLLRLSGDYQRLRAAVERMGEVAGAASAAPPAGEAELAPGGHEVRFEAVELRYAEGGPAVLADVSFAVEPGERVAIVGRSGAGKSSLVGLVARLYEPQRGRILIDGRDLRSYGVASLRREIGFVLQSTMLFAGSVRENIRFGDLAASDAEIEEMARAANAHEFISRLRHGYDSEIGERGVQLSGGERQRIGIARVLLRKPGILVLDEATSALDSEGERLVREALERLMAGRTTLVVAHRPSAFAGADRIVVLEEGRIVAVGRHRELVASCAVYRGLAGEGEGEAVPGGAHAVGVADVTGAGGGIPTQAVRPC